MCFRLQNVVSQPHLLIEYPEDEETGSESLSDSMMMRIASRFGLNPPFYIIFTRIHSFKKTNDLISI